MHLASGALTPGWGGLEDQQGPVGRMDITTVYRSDPRHSDSVDGPTQVLCAVAMHAAQETPISEVRTEAVKSGDGIRSY